MFKKGDVPANHMEVGEYTHTTDGYLIRKVKETGPQRERFEFVHRAVWEEHNGPVPEGKMVSFLDGNNDNCNIENLVLIDNEENLEMNRSRLRFADPERTKTGVLVAKARVTVRQKKRRKHNGFRWAPSVGAWQRHLNANGKSAVRSVIRDLEEMEAKA